MTVSEFVLPQALRSDRRTPLRWVLSHARRQWWLLILLLVGALGNASLAAVVPVLVGRAFNVMLSAKPDLRLVGTLALVIAGSQIGRGVLQLGRNFSAELSAQRVERDVRQELYLSLLGKSMTFHSLQPVGDTMARATNDVRQVNYLFSPGLNLVIGSANFMIVPLIVAPTYHPSLVLVPALYILGYGLAVAQYLRQLEPVTERVRQAFGTLNARLAEALDGIEVVKGHAREARGGRWVRGNAARVVRDASVRQGDIEARFLPLLLLALAEAGAFLHGLLLYRQGLLDVGQVIAFVGLIQLFGFPTFVSLWAYSQLSMGLASAQRILELINRETELDQNPRGHAAPMRGEIEFRDVTFGYTGSRSKPGAGDLPRPAGTDGGDRRADRRRQDIAGQAGQPHVRRLGRRGSGRRDRRARSGSWARCGVRSPSSSRTYSCSRAPSPRTSPSAGRALRRPRSRRRPRRRRPTSSSALFPTATARWSASAA